jgi:DNA polymerase theta
VNSRLPNIELTLGCTTFGQTEQQDDMADKSNVGIWHTPTLQTLQPLGDRHQTIQTFVTGQKRPYNDALSQPSDRQEAQKRIPPQPPLARRIVNDSLFPAEPPRLTASRIHHADGAAVSDLPSEYSQRQAFAATPTPTTDPLLSLSHPAYGLPRQLVANFAALGIKSIYPWQKQCLLGPGLLDGEKNLVYSAPTGGGKSLVADVLMLKRVLGDRDAKAILVLPYVALVQEKVRWLRNVVSGISREELGQGEQDDTKQKLWARRADRDTVRVVGFFGGSKIRATWADFDIAVCTIEKVRSQERV